MIRSEPTPLPILQRREALFGFLGAFTVVALVREARAVAPLGRGSAKAWIEGQQDIAEDLSAGRISGIAWAREVERLAAEVDVAELMALVRSSELIGTGTPPDNNPRKRFVRFRDEVGRQRRLAYGTALFEFEPCNVITPHGHRHMVSAHLIVGGRFRVRNFDRLADEAGAMRIRPTRDYVGSVGHVSTMCAERDNIHWFVPTVPGAATFDVIISGLEAGAPDHLIEAIDPLRARALADGSLLAPIIGFEEAAARYTAGI